MEDLSEELDFLDPAIWLLRYGEHGNRYFGLSTERLRAFSEWAVWGWWEEES